MENKAKKNNRFVAFLKRNVYYVIMGVCILAIGGMVTYALLNNNPPPEGPPLVVDPDPTDPSDPAGPSDPTDDPTDPTGSITPVVFCWPVEGGNIIVDYTMDTLVWHMTLGHYRVNPSIRIGGEADANVLAAYDGVVEKVYYDILDGNVITIRHSEDLVTTYGSLKDLPEIAIGATVKKGDILGKIGTSASAEFKEGAHVTFKVYEKGSIISPYTYLDIGDK